MNANLHRREFLALTGVAAVAGPSLLARASEPDPKRTAIMEKAAAYLRSQQDAATGGWSIPAQGPAFPAITALVVSGMLGVPGVSESDPAVTKGIEYMLAKQQSDGGIYDKLVPGYNTSICLSALSKVTKPAGVAEARAKALAFLRGLQWGEDAKNLESLGEPVKPVGKDNVFYGGVGYGRHGRPDLSNTAFFLEALHASGVDANDPAFQRALVFLQRTQMVEKLKGPDGKEMVVNDLAYAKGSRQGGFIYATGESKDNPSGGQSFAGVMDESLSDGTTASRLRCYGSMTYSGFKSYLYAGLKHDDPRVIAARQWIEQNYTLDENPGVGNDGLYYYYIVFARALNAFGSPTINARPASGAANARQWAADLVAKLATLQEEDGSFKSVDKRWMEDNKVLITSYALNALALAV